MNVCAVILAGGAGSRLGQVRKSEIRLGGETLLARLTGRLAIEKTSLLISTGPGPADPIAVGDALPDLDGPLGGPLAGIVAAVAHLRQRAPTDTVLLSVAVDTPFLPNDFVPRMLAPLAKGAPAAQAFWRGNAYPTNAAWSLSALRDLPERIVSDKAINSPKALLAQLGAVQVEWGDSHGDNPFANLNTLADLVTLARRSRQSSL